MKNLLILTLLCCSPAFAQQLTTAQAASKAGQTATVCGKVTDVHTALRSRGRPTFIDLDGRYPDQAFTLLVWGDEQSDLGDLNRYADKKVCAHGLIQEYRGGPEMILHAADQIKEEK